MVIDILTDVASGSNEKRRGLKKLFEYVVNGKVNIVIISYKDRLTRFGLSIWKSPSVRMASELRLYLEKNPRIYSKSSLRI